MASSTFASPTTPAAICSISIAAAAGLTRSAPNGASPSTKPAMGREAWASMPPTTPAAAACRCLSPTSPFRCRGFALGDLNNRGGTDLVLNQMNEPVVILRNRHETAHHWLGVELTGKPYRDAVGARLELEVGGQKLVRAIKGGGSYLSANDRRVIFGLGDSAQVGRLTVRWPSGKTQIWDNLAVDRYWKFNEE